MPAHRQAPGPDHWPLPPQLPRSTIPEDLPSCPSSWSAALCLAARPAVMKCPGLGRPLGWGRPGLVPDFDSGLAGGCRLRFHYHFLQLVGGWGCL